jgi:peptide-methionine (S)-S-oxide reductase
MSLKSVGLLFGALTGLFTLGCAQQPANSTMQQNNMEPVENFPDGKELATFAGGCFWCTEAIYEEVAGVEKVVSGYAGGKVDNPSYEAVCNGTTGHAECVQITYDPAKVSFQTLLDIHMNTHDPTTLNRQGNDVGTQYRSVVFYHNASQQEITEKYIADKDKEGAFNGKIVTQVEPFQKFFVAENYHQDYFANNGEQPYCVFVVKKKVQHFEQLYPNLMKEGYRIKQ